MTKDWVHGDGHSPVCQILLQIVVIALITSSPPAWTSSAGTLSTPADFPFFSDCTVASTSLWRMGWSSSVSVWVLFSTDGSQLALWQCHGRQRKCWMDNIKEWTYLPMPKLLTRTSCRKDWKRISAESSIISRWRPDRSRDWTALNWTENKLNIFVVQVVTTWVVEILDRCLVRLKIALGAYVSREFLETELKACRDVELKWQKWSDWWINTVQLVLTNQITEIYPSLFQRKEYETGITVVWDFVVQFCWIKMSQLS